MISHDKHSILYSCDVNNLPALIDSSDDVNGPFVGPYPDSAAILTPEACNGFAAVDKAFVNQRSDFLDFLWADAPQPGLVTSGKRTRRKKRGNRTEPAANDAHNHLTRISSATADECELNLWSERFDHQK